MDLLAMGGERKGIRTSVGSNIEKYTIRSTELFTPLYQGGLEEAAFGIIFEIDLRENIMESGSQIDDLIVGCIRCICIRRLG
jgi:hypothetical protein